MTKDQALELLRGGEEGVAEWNLRRDVGEEAPPLGNAELTDAKLSGVKLSGVILHDAKLGGAELIGAELDHANLSDACLAGVNLTDADLSNAILHRAFLFGAYLNRCVLAATDLANTWWGWTTLANVDLREAKGLDTARMMGSSSIGMDTLVRSRASIPESFLRGCGFQQWQILEARLYNPALMPKQVSELQHQIFDARTKGTIFLGGVLISYSHSNTTFVDKVRERLVGDDVLVWLDRHDLEAGPIVEQVGQAIDRNEAVLLVLSKHSIDSDWVAFEMSQARKKEKRNSRYVLCPVALDDAWKKKTGPIWQHLRDNYVILDFSKWETSAFDAEYKKLLNGLKKWYQPPSEDKAGAT